MRGRLAFDVEPPPYLSAVPVFAAGVIAAVLIVVRVSYPVAALGSVATWLTSVAGLWGLARPDPLRPAPWRISAEWRPYVRRAVAASTRYRSMLRALNPGPLQERLADAAPQVDRTALEVWRQALVADQLDSPATVVVDTGHQSDSDRVRQDVAAVRDSIDRLDAQLSALIGNVGRFVSSQDYGEGDAVVQLMSDIDALRGALEELQAPPLGDSPEHD